ncbi:uncharacterized protein LOC124460506 [Drosophila willistoni]|uniref:uncharacterized protein LOC124460506 n=1 Tax=Drosophila willistoni TaxID=7260 RepID=UPI001F079596|nr:uncharacterized protein LOC124460506 [Drosophila willistoni]
MLKIIIERKCGKPVEFRMASYWTIYDLKKRIDDRLSMSEGQCVLISSKGKVLDGDLIFEAAGLENCDPKKKPMITCFQGAQKIGALTVITEVETETDSYESFESVETCPDSQEVSLNKSDESLQDACGMIKCDKKPRAPSELDNQITMQQEKGTPPFVRILPENRQYIIVVSSDCKERNYCNLMQIFFPRFGLYRNVRCLKFNPETPVMEFGGRLYIAAANENTMDWVSEILCSIKGYQAVDLITYLRLSRAKVVWPNVQSCLVDVFKLLEKQNKGLKTEKWAVVNKKILDPCSEENITNICLNHEVILWIDCVSVELIKSKCYQLHYHFWNITFEFCS